MIITGKEVQERVSNWEGLAPLRKDVLIETQSWIGTPYRHGQKCKGAGVDCGKILIGIFENLDLIPHIEVDYYPKDFHLHRDKEWYKETMEQFADEIKINELQPADIVLYREGRLYSHGGVVLTWPWIVHAFGPWVHVADGTQGKYGRRPKKFYRPKVFV